MSPELLTSLQNPILKRFRAAAKSRKGECFLLEGRHLLQEALITGWPLDTVLVQSDRWEDWAARLQGRLAPHSVFLAPPQVIARLSTAASPEGVLALATRRDATWPEPGPRDLFLFLDEVQDPVNVGMLIRSARAFGLAGVFAGPGTADPYHPTVLARGAGAALHLPVLACSGEAFVAWAQRTGAHIVGTNARGVPLPKSLEIHGPAVLAMGNEGRGLSPVVTAACHVRYAIPMAEGWDSLNVAVAGALFMYTYSQLAKG